jgi:hypothetical protein
MHFTPCRGCKEDRGISYPGRHRGYAILPTPWVNSLYPACYSTAKSRILNTPAGAVRKTGISSPGRHRGYAILPTPWVNSLYPALHFKPGSIVAFPLNAYQMRSDPAILSGRLPLASSQPKGCSVPHFAIAAFGMTGHGFSNRERGLGAAPPTHAPSQSPSDCHSERNGVE